MIVPILYGNYYRTGFEQESSQKDVTITIIIIVGCFSLNLYKRAKKVLIKLI